MPVFHKRGISWEYSSQLLLLHVVSYIANIEAKKKPAAMRQSGIFMIGCPLATAWVAWRTPVVVGYVGRQFNEANRTLAASSETLNTSTISLVRSRCQKGLPLGSITFRRRLTALRGIRSTDAR